MRKNPRRILSPQRLPFRHSGTGIYNVNESRHSAQHAGAGRATEPTAIADKTGLLTLMQKRGFTRPQLVACINDKASRNKILAMTNEAFDKVMIRGTPGIVINGTLFTGTEWDVLKAALPPVQS